MKFWNILILICACKTSIILGALTTIDQIAALVNHNVILDSNIKNHTYTMQKNNSNTKNDALQQNIICYQTLLDQLITDELIIQIAEQNKITINYNSINYAINCVANLCGMTVNQFHIYLHNIGLNSEKYYLQQYQNILKKNICDNIAYHRSNIAIQEIPKTIKEINIINLNKQFKLRHITLSLPIQPTLQQINQVKHFAQLLIEEKKRNNNIKNLLHTYSNKKIIQIITVQETEWTSWQDIPIIFDKHLQIVKKGDIIGPILSHDGIHIAEIQEIRHKELIFPITKIKAKIFGIKNSHTSSGIRQQLLQIKENIEKGTTTFDTILKEKSKNTYFDYYEDDITWKNLDDIEPEIQKVFLSLTKNKISTPTYTNRGWCLIQLIDTNTLDYAAILHERAYLYLLNKTFDEIIKNWIIELRHASYIKIVN